MIGLLGIVVMLSVALLLSERRDRTPWRLVAMGLLTQLALGLLLFRVPFVAKGVDAVSGFINGVIERANAGIEFIFGPNLADPGGPAGFVFAIRVLPVIIFFASLMAVLYHMGVMQRLVALLAWLLRRTLRVTGVEAMAMASNVFVGQTEAPLCVKPYIDRMTRSQIMTLMVGGFATIAGSVLAAYVFILGGTDPEMRRLFTTHLLTASVMSAPAAFVMAKIIVPETEDPIDGDLSNVDGVVKYDNAIDAAASGATDGLKLALNVGAMLIAFVSLLALIDWGVRSLGQATGMPELSLNSIMGVLFMPLAFVMGVPAEDLTVAGARLGEKIIATEYIAYDNLGKSIQSGEISQRGAIIMTYALCGFANFASIAIQIGGLSAIAPSRRRDFVQLGLKAMIGGAMASFLTACIAGMVIR